MTRKYQMKRRARQAEETRRRITEAAVELHGTVGPARTTISAVADKAGVERLTVYRYFPDEHALFQACTGHWLADHPFPDSAGWASTANPTERLRLGLGELYAWYDQTEQMMANFFRDAPTVPALANRVDEWNAYLDQTRDVLARGWGPRARRRTILLATLAHALDFHTWSTLTRNGLDGTQAADLMTRLARVAAI